MTSSMKGVVFTTIMLVLAALILGGSLVGCGGKSGSGEETTGKTEETDKSDTASQEAQAGDFVFSVTASADTKTDTFQVNTSSQVLHYNVIGGEDATVTITVLSYPDGKMQAGANAFEPGPHEKAIYLKPGTYYMEILPDDCTVEVKLQD